MTEKDSVPSRVMNTADDLVALLKPSPAETLKYVAAQALKGGMKDTHDACMAGAAEIERLTAALSACQTYDYRQIIEESDRLRALLKEYRDAEWMVTHDWGGDRRALLAKIDAEFPAETPLKHSEPRLSLDTDRAVYFYEQDHYYLSNFSAFRLRLLDGTVYPTSEHAYQCAKLEGTGNDSLLTSVRCAESAHLAFKIAEEFKAYRRADWDAVKVDVMRDILRAKVDQHEYVHRKLLQTGNRELIENSWRDDYWGWGENRDGQNMLGKLWMQIRAELRLNQGVNSHE